MICSLLLHFVDLQQFQVNRTGRGLASLATQAVGRAAATINRNLKLDAVATICTPYSLNGKPEMEKFEIELNLFLNFDF